jgi:hypothetical protein
MTDHPITPPPELIAKWAGSMCGYYEAARWGADQELEACVEWLGDAPVVYNDNGDLHPGSYLRDARRPKSLSLKELALAVLENEPEADDMKELVVFDVDQVEIIRKALEQLDD